MHQLGGEPGRRPERGQLPPARRPGSRSPPRARAARRGPGPRSRPSPRRRRASRPGSRAATRSAGVRHWRTSRTPPVGVDRDDRDGARVAGDVALGAACRRRARSCRPGTRGTGRGGGRAGRRPARRARRRTARECVVGRGHRIRRRARRWRLDRAGRAGPIGSLGQAATVLALGGQAERPTRRRTGGASRAAGSSCRTSPGLTRCVGADDRDDVLARPR